MIARSKVEQAVGLCMGQVLLVDLGPAKVPQAICTGAAGCCLLDCLVANSAVVSLAFFAPLVSCGLHQILHIFSLPHTTLRGFLVAP